MRDVAVIMYAPGRRMCYEQIKVTAMAGLIEKQTRHESKHIECHIGLGVLVRPPVIKRTAFKTRDEERWGAIAGGYLAQTPVQVVSTGVL